jgi:hypothetical protein
MQTLLDKLGVISGEEKEREKSTLEKVIQMTESLVSTVNSQLKIREKVDEILERLEDHSAILTMGQHFLKYHLHAKYFDFKRNKTRDSILLLSPVSFFLIRELNKKKRHEGKIFTIATVLALMTLSVREFRFVTASNKVYPYSVSMCAVAATNNNNNINNNNSNETAQSNKISRMSVNTNLNNQSDPHVGEKTVIIFENYADQQDWILSIIKQKDKLRDKISELF